MLAAFQPMMKPLPSSSIQIKEEPSDLIGSNARKRRREILQSNRAAKTICTGAPLSTPISKITKDNCSSATSTITSRLPVSNNPRTDSTANLRHMSNIFKTPPYCQSQSESTRKKLTAESVAEKKQTTAAVTSVRDTDKEAVQILDAEQLSDAKLDADNTANAYAKKKPQMRYDPSVPMTKEAAAVWRREQRRKRNRDSAAASRQRQRNRISELEDEVAEWKIKFDNAMAQLAEQEMSLKHQTQHHDLQTITTSVSISSSSGSISELMPDFVPKSPIRAADAIHNGKPRAAMVFDADCCSAVSPCPCPPLTSDLSHTVSSDVLSLSCSQALLIDEDVEGVNVPQGIKIEQQDQQQQILGNVEAKKVKNLNEISRPA